MNLIVSVGTRPTFAPQVHWEGITSGGSPPDRLRDVLKNAGYTRLYRYLPEYKDFNEDLKARHGVQPLPAVPHRRKEVYFSQVQAVQLRKFAPERLRSLLQSALANGQYHTLAEYALSGSAYFLGDAGMFGKLKIKLSQQYRAYTDKGRMQTKQDNLNDAFSAVFRDFKQNARTREQCIQTAKLLYELADCAIRCETQSSMEISTEPCEELENEPEQQVSQGW